MGDTKMQEPIKQAADVAAAGTGIATFFGWLPDIAALLTVIWLTLRIYESETVQGWLKRP